MLYRSDTVSLNTVNLKFHLIQIFYEVSVNIFSVISCLEYTANVTWFPGTSLGTNLDLTAGYRIGLNIGNYAALKPWNS